MMATDIINRGLFEFQHGNFKTAEQLFTKIIDQNDEEEDILESLKRRATCLHEMGKYDDAIIDANRVMKLAPKCTSGYAICGNALTRLKNYEDALNTYKLGLEIDSNDEAIKNGLKFLQMEIMENFEKSQKESTYNAVKMSSQEPYPGDNELEVYEREIMQTWGLNEFPDFDMAVPDTQKAILEFQEALQLKKAGNDKNALEKMRSALRYDPADFTLRGEMAMLLFELGEYKEGFQHVQCIPSTFRPAKYWKIGGKILDALNLPVHAESWLRNGTKADKSDMEMPLLFQNIRVKRLYGPLTENTKVGVVFTHYGRAIQAAEDIKPGENCFRDKAAVLAQTLDTLNVTACNHCAKCLMRPEDYFGKDLLAKNKEVRTLIQRHWPYRPITECKGCGNQTVYCSTECRDESWNTYHQVLCTSVNPDVQQLHTICSQYKNLSNDNRVWKGVWNASYSPMVLAKIWASIICLANNIANQEGRQTPTQADWTMAKSPFRKFIAYGNTSVLGIIPKMLTMMQGIFDNENLPAHFRYKITNQEFDGRYYQATCNVQAFSDPAPPFKVFMNSVSKDPKRDLIVPYTKEDPDDALFAGMFPLHACLNHSCANNVEVLDGHPGVLVRARLPVKKGDELFTTYINSKLPRKERRSWLFRGYNFWCHCPRCKFEGDGPDKCTECDKVAKDEGKDKYPGCGKCHRAWYCSTSCQKTAWKKGHKKVCNISC
ncbi:uncharacterized protein LOC128241535 isoform X2 [Mya arenaria]|uniref:uncharacterized protein LOC128241535 isoform X2 n=1 Tax=Mya arenaria TaxID=6604 RepID=UPI0022E3C623|nr:uncharacterized protein LOC128241535 isoform X2 [Mya arenaria]